MEKITAQHRQKPAYIYIRQSTMGQVRHHQESTERQYALRDKALELGWDPSAIRILDKDLGRSGAQTTGREDFKALVAEVSMGQAGAVFSLEASRLARSNLDWHRLLKNQGVRVVDIYYQYRKPRPMGVVRVQRLCQLNDSNVTPKLDCSNNINEGVTNESISKTITCAMALPIPYCLGAEIPLEDIDWAAGRRSK